MKWSPEHPGGLARWQNERYGAEGQLIARLSRIKLSRAPPRKGSMEKRRTFQIRKPAAQLGWESRDVELTGWCGIPFISSLTFVTGRTSILVEGTLRIIYARRGAGSTWVIASTSVQIAAAGPRKEIHDTSNPRAIVFFAPALGVQHRFRSGTLAEAPIGKCPTNARSSPGGA